MSLFRSYFDAHAAPALLHYQADRRLADITYQMGDVEIRGLDCVVRPRQQEIVMDDDGSDLKREICSLVYRSNPCDTCWRGVEDTQLKGQFVFTESNGDETVWGIDTLPGRGVEANTGSLTTVHLVRLTGVAKTYQGSHKRNV